LSAESEQLLAQSDDLLFDVGGSLAGLVMRSAGKLDEAARPLLLINGAATCALWRRWSETNQRWA